MDGEEGLEAKEILDCLRLPDSEMSTLRRDLNALKDSGLVIAKGVKPITYYPAAEKVELRIDEDADEVYREPSSPSM
jgi:Fe2+ or Zn2+ uptake regulation protein